MREIGVPSNMIGMKGSPYVDEGPIVRYYEERGLLVTATFDVYTKIAGPHTIKIWEIATGEEKSTFTLKGHEHVVRQIELSPDAKSLASASEDTGWRVAEGAEMLMGRNSFTCRTVQIGRFR